MPLSGYEKQKRWRAKNPDKWKASYTDYAKRKKEERLAYQRAHRAKNADKYREYNAKWHRENRKNNPAKVRAMHLKSNYGITLETYETMLTSQDGVCAACGRSPEQERHKVLHVDHCHNSEVIRGLLCSRCNTALGLVEDDPMRLHRYLLARSLALP